jgi:hypothetical protein
VDHNHKHAAMKKIILISFILGIAGFISSATAQTNSNTTKFKAVNKVATRQSLNNFAGKDKATNDTKTTTAPESKNSDAETSNTDNTNGDNKNTQTNSNTNVEKKNTLNSDLNRKVVTKTQTVKSKNVRGQ